MVLYCTDAIDRGRNSYTNNDACSTPLILGVPHARAPACPCPLPPAFGRRPRSGRGSGGRRWQRATAAAGWAECVARARSGLRGAVTAPRAGGGQIA
eukprot:scaffold8513_cov111-Isochrysis_galbana.AAC.3